MENRHSQSVPAEIKAQAIAKIREVLTLLSPYVVTLTPEERHDMLKMGDKTLAFVEKARSYMHENPELVPPYVDVAAFEIDFADASGLTGLLSSIEQVHVAVSDTVMEAGSEAFHAALSFYNYLKGAAANHVIGAEELYRELKLRFPAGRKKQVTAGTE